jgi:hypothetical protein
VITAPVLAVKDAVVALTGIASVETTVSRLGLPPEMVTVTAKGAGFVSNTVQVVLESGARVDGVHWNNEMSGGAASVMEALTEAPLREAVTVTVWSAMMGPVLAANVALAEPAGTVTEVGTTRRLATAPEIDTTAPPAPTASVRVTMQEVVALEASVSGAHWSEETSGRTVIEPELAVILTTLPSAAAPRLPFSTKGIFVNPETVPVTVATTPSAITFVFVPYAIQTKVPVAAPHVSVLPAAVNAGPAVSETFESVAGELTVHCSAATLVPDDIARERLSATRLPGGALADERVREG